MSDYVRKKCVRFKFADAIIKELKLRIERDDLWEDPIELLLKDYELKDCYDTGKNNFTINSGLNFETGEYDYFLDYLLDYEYGASGDFEEVRFLTDKEFEKYKELFKPYFDIINKEALRLVHYCYYNGVDEPSVYELEEI